MIRKVLVEYRRKGIDDHYCEGCDKEKAQFMVEKCRTWAESRFEFVTIIWNNLSFPVVVKG